MSSTERVTKQAKRRIKIRLPDNLVTFLRAKARQLGKRDGELLDEAIREFCASHKPGDVAPSKFDPEHPILLLHKGGKRWDDMK